ncbi:hypothetical protein [Arthrobacter psychrochitiniphilus]|uniref:hypothetical protein n=1 Tax=Arthrobacter psychrochitiniphilus TaxID=291045 RepID=UPI003F7C36F1
MAQKKFSKKTKLVAATAGLVLIGGGAAFAYWSTTGAGTGAATNADSNGTVTLVANFTPGLTPAGTRAVTYTASNPGTSSLYVGTLKNVVTTSDIGCLPADFTIPDVVSNTTVAAGAVDAPLTGTGTLTFKDTAINQDACKSATITLTVTSN